MNKYLSRSKIELTMIKYYLPYSENWLVRWTEGNFVWIFDMIVVNYTMIIKTTIGTHSG